MTERVRNRRWMGGLAVLLASLLGACGPKTPPLQELTAEQLWERGIAEYNEEEWDDAARYFDRFVLLAGADPRVYQARYYIGQARFNMEEYVTAAAEFARLAGDLGRNELADDARFLACRAYEELSPDPQLDQEYTRGAIEHCAALVEYFPDSERVPEARAIIERMQNRLAAKVFEGGDWYFDRRAYDSAIIYFEDVASQYADTDYAPRALLRLVQIYEILQYEEEREAARQLLLSEYPDSPEAREVQ